MSDSRAPLIKLMEAHGRWWGEVQAYQKLVEDASVAKAEYERARAAFIWQAREGDPKMSVAAAVELAADDEFLYGVLLRRLGAEAAADGAGKRLRWFESYTAALRTEVASERAADQLTARIQP